MRKTAADVPAAKAGVCPDAAARPLFQPLSHSLERGFCLRRRLELFQSNGVFFPKRTVPDGRSTKSPRENHHDDNLCTCCQL